MPFQNSTDSHSPQESGQRPFAWFYYSGYTVQRVGHGDHGKKVGQMLILDWIWKQQKQRDSGRQEGDATLPGLKASSAKKRKINERALLIFTRILEWLGMMDTMLHFYYVHFYYVKLWTSQLKSQLCHFRVLPPSHFIRFLYASVFPSIGWGQ